MKPCPDFADIAARANARGIMVTTTGVEEIAGMLATPSPSTDTLEKTVADIGDDELIRRVIAGLVKRPRTTRARTEPLWSRVGKRFSLGSTYLAQLCRRFKFNPDEQVLP